MLDQQCSSKFRVILVDYGDPDDSFHWSISLKNPRLESIKILNNTNIFNLSRARNCGANLLPSDILCFVDADSLLHPQFLEFTSLLLRSDRADLCTRDWRDGQPTTCGLCCVNTNMFHLVRGYDESFQGWGPEDLDFYARIEHKQGRRLIFPISLYPSTLPHSDADRTRFYCEKNIFQSAKASVKRSAKPNRLVNEIEYGSAHMLVHLSDQLGQINSHISINP